MMQLVATAEDGRRFQIDPTTQFRDVVGVPCHPDIFKRFQPAVGVQMNALSGDTIELLGDNRVEIWLRETGDFIPGTIAIEKQP